MRLRPILPKGAAGGFLGAEMGRGQAWGQGVGQAGRDTLAPRPCGAGSSAELSLALARAGCAASQQQHRQPAPSQGLGLPPPCCCTGFRVHSLRRGLTGAQWVWAGVFKLEGHRPVNAWCPKEPGPAQPLGCEEGVPSIWKRISNEHHCPGKLESPGKPIAYAHFYFKR